MDTKTARHSLDMLHGSLIKKILLFALPIAASSILQQLFNSADTAVAGQFRASGCTLAYRRDHRDRGHAADRIEAEYVLPPVCGKESSCVLANQAHII